MPAVTVDDVLTLPRVVRPDRVRRPRADRCSGVTTAPGGLEGEGFPVRRAFAGVDPARLDPFVHMDQMGEVEYAPGEAKGTPWHPHRGFETVTYMIDGTFRHMDSIGGGGLITNGDTQWMTAGSGILHIEAPPARAGGVGRAVPRRPAVGEPAAVRQDDRPRLPGHRGGERLPADHPGRRGAAAPGRRGRSTDTPGPGSTHSPDGHGARHRGGGGLGDAALGSRLQRARLRAGGRRDGGRGPPAGDRRTARRLRAGRFDHLRGVVDAVGAHARARRAGPGRSAHRRARLRLRTVRDEHPGRGGPGVRGLPGGRMGRVPDHYSGF